MVRADSSSASSPLISAGQGIALCVLTLLVIGVVMVNSAGMSVDPTRAVTAESLLLSKSTIYMALAMLALLATALMPIRRVVSRLVERRKCDDDGSLDASAGAGCAALSGLSETDDTHRGLTPPANAVSPLRGWTRHVLDLWPVWAFACGIIAVLGMVYLPVIGKEVNHSHRWINLHAPGLDSIQPSEIAKWALIVLMAWFACRNARHMSSFWKGLIPGLAAAGAVSAVIVLEDLGTGALLGMVACIMLVAAGVRFWHLLILAPFPLAAMAAAIITSPYRMHRILAFLNPYEDPQGIGYHMIQSMVAVANGQVFGTGLGHGLQKFGYLPEDTTDFVFAIVCEELGVFGATLVIFLYAALLLCILGVIKREPSRFCKLVALGVLTTVGLQAMINLAVVTGLGPTKGIALPLLSSGGTGWILTAASLGLVIAMDRTRAEAMLALARSAPVVTDAAGAVVEQVVSIPAGLSESTDAAMSPFSDDAHFAPQLSNLVTTVSLTDSDMHMLLTDEPFADTPLAAIEHTPALAPSMDVAAGETGILFAETSPAAQAPQTPEVVVTDEGREWPPQVSSTIVTPA